MSLRDQIAKELDAVYDRKKTIHDALNAIMGIILPVNLFDGEMKSVINKFMDQPNSETKKCEEGCDKCPSFHTNEKPVCPCKCHTPKEKKCNHKMELYGIRCLCKKCGASLSHVTKSEFKEGLEEKPKPECDHEPSCDRKLRLSSKQGDYRQWSCNCGWEVMSAFAGKDGGVSVLEPTIIGGSRRYKAGLKPKEPEKCEVTPCGQKHMEEAFNHWYKNVAFKSPSDYYTRDEIDSQTQLLFEMMKSVPKAAKYINAFIEEKKEFKRAFPFL